MNLNIFKKKKSVNLNEFAENFRQSQETEMEVTTKYTFNKKRLITFNSMMVNLLREEKLKELKENNVGEDYLIFLDTLIAKHHNACNKYASYVQGFERGRKTLNVEDYIK